MNGSIGSVLDDSHHRLSSMMMGEDALFNLRWDAQRSALLGSMATLYREEAFVDTTIVADNKIFKAHKLLLSASSSYLRSILESVPASQHAVICMPQVSSIDMGNLLRFIYEGQIKISRRSLRPFLVTAKLLRIKGMDFELNEDIDMALLPPHQLNRGVGSGSSSSPINSRAKQHSSADESSGKEEGQKEGEEDDKKEDDDKSHGHDDDKKENGEDNKPRSGSQSPSNGNGENNNNNGPNGDRASPRSPCGRSVHSGGGEGEMDNDNDNDMVVCSGGEESNHSNSMEPLQLISLSRLAAASAAASGSGSEGDRDRDRDHHNNNINHNHGPLNLVDHHQRMLLGDDRDDHDRDEIMSNGAGPDYDDDDDEDHHFSMSIQPEVSLRESDESYSLHSNHSERRASHQSSPHSHSALEIKQVPNLLTTSAFAGLPNTSGMTMTPFGGSSALHNLHALKSLNKLRPLIPKAAHQSSAAAAASQFQSMSEGILLRMMRGEPPHLGHAPGGGSSTTGNNNTGVSLKRDPGGSSSSSSSVLSHHASSFFDLGHGDTSHHPGGTSVMNAGLRKQKRYVQCTSCSKVLSSLSALKRHMEDVHCARIQGKCLLCGRVYSSRNSLLTHVYSAHKKHHDYKAVARIIRESDFEQFATA